STVACASRGYHPSGAAIVRPSANSTDSVSSLTSTPTARLAWVSTAEELMPPLQQLCLVLLDQHPYEVNLLAAESVAALQAHRIELELGFAVIPFDVDVRWFAAIACVKEKPVRPTAENRRH